MKTNSGMYFKIQSSLAQLTQALPAPANSMFEARFYFKLDFQQKTAETTLGRYFIKIIAPPSLTRLRATGQISRDI